MSARPPLPPRSRSAARLLLDAAIVVAFLLALSVLALRAVVLPRVDEYRVEIAAALSRAVGAPVSIEGLAADWDGLRPRVHMDGFVVHDAEGTPALRFANLDATLAWSSLLRLEPHFIRLVLQAPELSLVREPDGRIAVAGLPPRQGKGGGFADWALTQHELVVRDATLSWTDAARGNAVLRFEAVDLRITRVGARYRFGMQARPSSEVAAAVDIRADLVSDKPANSQAWDGQVYATIKAAHLDALSRWIDYPLPLAGHGDLRTWTDLEGGRVTGFLADVALRSLTTRLAPSLPPIEAYGVAGRVGVSVQAAATAVTLQGFELLHADGFYLAPTDLALQLSGPEPRSGRAGRVRGREADVGVLARLAAYFPLPEHAHQRLAALAPKGLIDEFRLEWDRGEQLAPTWRVDARFRDLAFQPWERFPGATGVSGEVTGDQGTGRFTLTGEDFTLALPQVFHEPLVPVAALDAQGGWAERGGRKAIVVDHARFENRDAAGSLSGLYYPELGGRGEIDVSGRLERADASAVGRYLPLVVGERTRSWLRKGVRGANVSGATFAVRGRLDDFPFESENDGDFRVDVDFSEGVLQYADGWPEIDAIAGRLRFERAAMELDATQGRVFGVALSDVHARIPHLNPDEGAVMSLQGHAEGASADFLRFVAQSPLGTRAGAFVAGMSAQGTGALDLTLEIPLREIADTRVAGEFDFSRNTITLVDWLPALSNASARVRFTEDSLAIAAGRANAFGEPLTVTAQTPAPGHLQFSVEGGLAAGALRTTHDSPLLDHLSGGTQWQAGVDVKDGGVSVRVDSTLEGISSSLPYPMNKRAAQALPLEVIAEVAAGGGRTSIESGLGDNIRLALTLGRDAVVEGGGVSFFAPLRRADTGVMVTAHLDEFDADAWREVLAPGGPISLGGEDISAPPVLAGAQIDGRRMRLLGQDFGDFELFASADAGGWNGRLASDIARGGFDWRNARDGALRLRLEHLAVGKPEPTDGQAAKAVAPDAIRALPGMDIIAERFALRGMELGRLELRARNEGGVWAVDALSLATPESMLSGAGRWYTGEHPRTDLDINLQTSDVGALLGRIGYPKSVRAGSALLQGEVSWQGAPTRLDFPSLSGALSVTARDGQFSRLEPGVGRLLGVLSLQSLPRRLKLDFRDVFSEGFAFDSVSGSIDLRSGMMRSDDLHISGPSARIWIGGSTDLVEETQDLKVVVQPTLSEGVAIGAAAGLINPVAGVIAYLAQRVLSDPIERMFAFGYEVTGTWSDPQVAKLPVGPKPSPDGPGGE